MKMPLTKNNRMFDILRRAAIGTLLGLFIVLIWSVFIADHSPKIVSDISFDSETVQLSQRKERPQVNVPAPPSPESLDNTANSDEIEQYYPFFATFKAPLNTDQKAAIQSGSPTLSVIVSNAGQSDSLTQVIIEKLSNNVTVSLSPYLDNHNSIASQLSEYGFEIWMDLAAITLSINEDNGPLALNPANNLDNNVALLTEQLNNKDKVTGVVLPPRALIIETNDLWADIVNNLYAEGYGIIDNTAQVMKPGLFFHEDRRAPYMKGDRVLSDTLTLAQLKEALSSVRKTVLEQGNIIITVPISTPAALDILSDWVNSLGQEGITLVPVSAQAKL